jgi:hypothetical protein
MAWCNALHRLMPFEGVGAWIGDCDSLGGALRKGAGGSDLVTPAPVAPATFVCGSLQIPTDLWRFGPGTRGDGSRFIAKLVVNEATDMNRRDLLIGAGAIALTTPVLARAASERVLKFIPQSDLAALDPVWTSATVTRNHAYLVFDTLFAQDSSFRAQPQMVAGYTTENDGKL